MFYKYFLLLHKKPARPGLLQKIQINGSHADEVGIVPNFLRVQLLWDTFTNFSTERGTSCNRSSIFEFVLVLLQNSRILD